MDNTNEKLNTLLYQKMFDEQQEYRNWLLSQPPEIILEYTYSYTVRQDILLAAKYYNFSDEQALALLSSPSPLEDILHDFEQIEGDYMDIIRGCIETRANEKALYQGDRFQSGVSPA